MTDDFWLNEFKRQMQTSDPTIEHQKKILQLCIDWLDETENREEKMQLLTMTIQLKSSIAILTRLGELKHEVQT